MALNHHHGHRSNNNMGAPYARNVIAIACATMRLIWIYYKMDIRLRKKWGIYTRVYITPGRARPYDICYTIRALEMNALQRSRSERSDFSIARILADDRAKDDEKTQDLFNRTDSIHLFQSHAVTGSTAHSEQIGTMSNIVSARNLNLELCEERLTYQGSLKKGGKDESRESHDVTEARSIDALEDTRGYELTVSYGEQHKNELTWLQYTRYKPPKLPRRSLVGKNVKRRPGVHPRIPFSSFQLQVLEDTYRRNAYLSRRDALDISSSLRLPQSRVKIWFQNRRARDRRESNNATAVT